MAYRLKAPNILTIVQYEKADQNCGVIRDVVQSRDHDRSFVWECSSRNMRSEVIVGTWPAKHSSVKGPAVEAWRIKLKALKFEEVQAHCLRRLYARGRKTLKVVLAHRLHLGGCGSDAAEFRADAQAGGSLAEK